MDFTVDDTGDLDFSNNDFKIESNELGHIESVLLAHKGEWKQYPMIGVGISKYLNSPLSPTIRVRLEKEIKLQLESDLFKNIFVEVNESGVVNVKADRNELFRSRTYKQS